MWGRGSRVEGEEEGEVAVREVGYRIRKKEEGFWLLEEG
jgi:hypothetical protein